MAVKNLELWRIACNAKFGDCINAQNAGSRIKKTCADGCPRFVSEIHMKSRQSQVCTPRSTYIPAPWRTAVENMSKGL